MSIILNDVIEVGDKLYYEINPNTKMDVPSFFYEKIESLKERWIYLSDISPLYDYCKKELIKTY